MRHAVGAEAAHEGSVVYGQQNGRHSASRWAMEIIIIVYPFTHTHPL